MIGDSSSIFACRFKGTEDAVGKLTGGAQVEAAATTVIGSRPIADPGRRYARRTGSGHLS
jgi:hypothetical protein